MKKIIIRWSALVGLLLLVASCGREKQPKYVFYIIGDGMGANHVTLAQMYSAALRDTIGADTLAFTTFPEMALATTYSSSNSITCSAAAGTALATGHKTSVGTIGMDPAHKESFYSIAVKAKEAGMKVGITTSVSVDHATPASFYAHQTDRDMYYQIGFDAIKANFDLYAGSGFLENKNPKDANAPALFPALDSAGYTIARGYEEFKAKTDSATKIVLMEKDGADKFSLVNAIDRDDKDLTLAQIVEGSINYLLKKSDDKGFFLMIEGGKIDWLAHAQDGGAMVREVQDLSEAMQKVMAFYRAHKDETLVIVTADHETGGLGLGKSGYDLNLKALSYQKVSKEKLSKIFSFMQTQNNRLLTWDEVKDVLSRQLGFWSNIPLTADQEEQLKECYTKSFVKHEEVVEKTLYTSSGAMSAVSIKILNDIAKIGWTTSSHTASSVPVYAIGVGSKHFDGLIDNTDIPKRMAKIMKLELK